MSGPIAGFDCTGETFSVALVRDGEVLAEAGGLSPRSHLRLLLPALVECASRAGVPLSALAGVAVTTGPGSFTGLRLGIVTARTVAQVLGCPVIPVSTLEALALNVGSSPRVVAALDARRGEIFAATFAVSAGEAVRLTEDAGWTPSDLAASLAGTGAVVVGSAAARYAAELAVPGVELLPPAYAQIRGSAVARLGARGSAVPIFDLAPSYMRAAEVQIHSSSGGQR